MKILLINPGLGTKNGNHPTSRQPLGLLYIVSYLKQMGVSVSFKDFNVNHSDKTDPVEHILKTDPDIVGLYTSILNYKEVLRIACECKKKNDSMLFIAGGPMASASPEAFLSNGYFDFVVIGEGEVTMFELINAIEKEIDLNYIKGIAYRQNNAVIKTKQREPIKDLDTLPFPDYSMINFNDYRYALIKRRPYAPLTTSRGCPYSCIYCDKSVFGCVWRPRSPENVLSEMEYLINNFGVREILMVDDNLTLDMNRAERIFDLMIEHNLDLTWSFDNGVRADRLNEKLLDKAVESGCWKISLAPETGDEEILRKIGKNFKLDDVKNVVKWSKDRGLFVHCYFMLGLPWDTRKTMQKTIDFANELDPDFVHFSITTPIINTKLYDIVKTNGYFISDPLGSSYFSGNAVYEIYDLKREDVKEMYKKAYQSFYLKPKRFINLLRKLPFELVIHLASFGIKTMFL